MMGNRDRELAILQSRLFLELRRTHCRVIDLKWMASSKSKCNSQ